MPPNKDFAFITFAAHEQARAAIDSRGKCLRASYGPHTYMHACMLIEGRG